jgi:hypothetical protein
MQDNRHDIGRYLNTSYPFEVRSLAVLPPSPYLSNLGIKPVCGRDQIVT